MSGRRSQDITGWSLTAVALAVVAHYVIPGPVSYLLVALAVGVVGYAIVRELRGPVDQPPPEDPEDTIPVEDRDDWL